MTGGGGFSNVDHFMDLREERRDGHKNWDDENYATLKGLVGYLIGTDHRLILCAKNTGAWLNVRGTTVTGTVFLAT